MLIVNFEMSIIPCPLLASPSLWRVVAILGISGNLSNSSSTSGTPAWFTRNAALDAAGFLFELPLTHN